MFTDNPNIKKLHGEIYLYKNFIDQSLIEKINFKYDKLTEDTLVAEYHEIDWYHDKTGPEIPELLEVWEKVNQLISPKYVAHPNLTMLVSKPGQPGMFVHSDSPGEDEMDQLTQTDRWSTCCLLSYGAVVYFGDFTGGEVYYPNVSVNKRMDFEVKVEPGDLIIHGALAPYEHGTRPTRTGKRYAYSLFILEAGKNPGTFYNYGTKECELQIKNDGLDAWLTPLYINPQFKDRIDAY